MSTISNDIPLVPENTIDPAAGLNLSLNTIDALLQLAVLGIGVNAPPASPATGDRYVIGTAPTDDWAGRAGQLARWDNGGWYFYVSPRLALNLGDGLLYKRDNTGWGVVSGGSGAVQWADVQGVPANVSALGGLSGSADTVPYFTGSGVMSLSAFTAQARLFLAASTQAAQQAALGLVPTESAVDTVNSRTWLQTGNGRFGLGGVAIGRSTLAEIQSVRASEIFMSGSTNPANNPFAIAGVGFHFRYSTTNAAQIFAAVTANRFFGASYLNGVWQPASEFWTTYNLTPNQLTSYTIATLPSAAANPRLQAYCSNLTGGAAPVYCNGTQWLRVADNTVVN